MQVALATYVRPATHVALTIDAGVRLEQAGYIQSSPVAGASDGRIPRRPPGMHACVRTYVRACRGSQAISQESTDARPVVPVVPAAPCRVRTYARTLLAELCESRAYVRRLIGVQGDQAHTGAYVQVPRRSAQARPALKCEPWIPSSPSSRAPRSVGPMMRRGPLAAGSTSSRATTSRRFSATAKKPLLTFMHSTARRRQRRFWTP